MATTPDRRVRRTRAALRDALLSLMAERGYEAVTVHEIIDRADVGRSTFYNHYTDKDELLHDTLGELQSILAAPAKPVGGTQHGLRFSLPLLRHVAGQRRLGGALFGRGNRTPVLARIQDVLTEVVRTELAAAPGRPPRIPDEAVAHYVVGAYLSLLDWWLTSAPELAAEDADRIFQTLVMPGLRGSSSA
ncbi:TetR/AcrR family transcriptional regulator [Actinoplanes oblitus]|uniref:TetR/AcrR family transcriptional regulator n=1 Tax=Actinoplanes oblitus TaxID=3040509 RepID=A0ABY8WU04_9ACTN|nr:TetR/AcrR family transcriptional regulator [Actinoplanes oblitus]WIN00318.1 TetR/AcrR family transcriptional regulator [Actinoplanes oblitus]